MRWERKKKCVEMPRQEGEREGQIQKKTVFCIWQERKKKFFVVVAEQQQQQ